ncbi:MAG: mechanosensitive ion channel family protein [Gammaproteobacteria bacterium]|nr:mechanosensitive ion channel family protein [Gammaproteobacteria bacterium]
MNDTPLTPDALEAFVRASVIVKAIFLVMAGWLLARLASSAVKRLFSEHLSRHHLILARRAVFYIILALFLVSALRELGFKLHVLMGAAGIMTLALGFASQTSASNIISGLFLLGERPFSLGDVVKVGDTTGEVISIDLLSVKIRTSDNVYVRIPNETILKSSLTTLSKFPIRRLDLQLGVAYKEDIRTVREVLFKIADKNPLCLDEPKPILIFQGFGDSSIDLQLSVWTQRENFLELKSSIQIEIKEAFDRLGIEIPFPHRTLYAGSATEPMPVRVESDDRARADY